MRLFVYGTLLGDSDTAAARWLQPRVRSATHASVPGRLLAIPTSDGWFPALVRGSVGDRVCGAVCDLAFGRGDLRWLDAYEGREYRRDVARALLTEAGRAKIGQRVTVQLYRWRIPLPAGAQRIPRGDFLVWLCSSRARAYGPPNGGRSSQLLDRSAILAGLTDTRIAAGPGSMWPGRSIDRERERGQ